MLHARKDYNVRIQDSENLIPEDEPVFLLRGQDKLAPMLLDLYTAISEENEECDKNIITAVKRQSELMREWQFNEASKFADMNVEDIVV